ncbi:PK interacting protein [Apocheima cinerarium nucleopolyhedrovirus]|uniref:PK interacting protein n=1 Tax=Apocheima cinerarium nucleopolyhedrovirus TaxID=307461 RepID=UPI0001D920BA|nr:PK interacting protein [Apocheima cinerarium nucleopolyhedrovirus]ADB84447.1 PK interacting protein [Apocheima cinerarium nucleopolyhedrovirus]
MEDHIINLTMKYQNYQDEYQKKVLAFFSSIKKPNFATELYIMSATIMAIEQQLNCLTPLHTEQIQTDFVNNLNEFKFDSETLDKLIADKNFKQFVRSQFNVDESFNEKLLHVLECNSNKFVRTLCEFVKKRNAYRKKPKHVLLHEIVLLKSLMIRYMTIMTKIVEYKDCKDKIENDKKPIN